MTKAIDLSFSLLIQKAIQITYPPNIMTLGLTPWWLLASIFLRGNLLLLRCLCTPAYFLQKYATSRVNCSDFTDISYTIKQVSILSFSIFLDTYFTQSVLTLSSLIYLSDLVTRHYYFLGHCYLNLGTLCIVWWPSPESLRTAQKYYLKVNTL